MPLFNIFILSCVMQVVCHNIATKVLHYFLPRLRMSQAIMLLIVRATVPVMALLAATIAAVRNDTGEQCYCLTLLLTLLTAAMLGNTVVARCHSALFDHSELAITFHTQH
jgi:Na+/proline symporter